MDSFLLASVAFISQFQVSLTQEAFAVSDEAIVNLKRLEKLSITNSNLLQLPEKLFCGLKNLQVSVVTSLDNSSFMGGVRLYDYDLLMLTGDISYSSLFERCAIDA